MTFATHARQALNHKLQVRVLLAPATLAWVPRANHIHVATTKGTFTQPATSCLDSLTLHDEICGKTPARPEWAVHPCSLHPKTLLSMLEGLVVIVVPKVKKSIMCSGSSNKPSQKHAARDTITHCSRLTW